jgi:hypothetical protein
VYTVPAHDQLDRWRTLGRDIFYAMNDPATMDIGALKVRISSMLVLKSPPKPPEETD